MVTAVVCPLRCLGIGRWTLDAITISYEIKYELFSHRAEIYSHRTRSTRPGTVAIVDHVLRTERLVLQPVTADDHAVLLAHWAAPDVRRFLFDGAMLPAAEITEAIEDSARGLSRAGYGLWLVH